MSVALTDCIVPSIWHHKAHCAVFVLVICMQQTSHRAVVSEPSTCEVTILAQYRDVPRLDSMHWTTRFLSRDIHCTATHTKRGQRQLSASIANFLLRSIDQTYIISFSEARTTRSLCPALDLCCMCIASAYSEVNATHALHTHTLRRRRTFGRAGKIANEFAIRMAHDFVLK